MNKFNEKVIQCNVKMIIKVYFKMFYFIMLNVHPKRFLKQNINCKQYFSGIVLDLNLFNMRILKFLVVVIPKG